MACDISEDLASVGRKILPGKVIGLGNGALRINEITHPTGQPHLVVVFALFTLSMECPTGLTTGIRQQLIRERR